MNKDDIGGSTGQGGALHEQMSEARSRVTGAGRMTNRKTAREAAG
jgi:hypothetical protein